MSEKSGLTVFAKLFIIKLRSKLEKYCCFVSFHSLKSLLVHEVRQKLPLTHSSRNILNHKRSYLSVFSEKKLKINKYGVPNKSRTEGESKIFRKQISKGNGYLRYLNSASKKLIFYQKFCSAPNFRMVIGKKPKIHF